MKKELIIKQGDKIVCPNCGQEAKRWDGRTPYTFLCWCKVWVKVEITPDGKATVCVGE